MSVTEAPQPDEPLRFNWAIVALIVTLAVGVLGAGVWLATRSEESAVEPQAMVMPGHGAVMPTDVTAVAPAGHLKVMMGDYWFKPSARRLHAGRYVFTAQNVGVVPHDIMLEKAPIEMAGPDAPVDEAAPYGLDDMEPRMVKSTTAVLDAGTWVLFCSVPGHYAAGQRMTLHVYGKLPKGMHMPKKQMMDSGGMDSDGMGS